MRADSAQPRKGFTLLELVVVVCVVALMVATQLPGLSRARSPARDTRCLSNCRQLGVATALYREENDDRFPYGNRVSGPGTGAGSVLDLQGWPMQLLPFMGGYSNAQPTVFLCPNERREIAGWAFQVHYQGNRNIIADVNAYARPVRGTDVRTPARYWMFLEKEPSGFCSISPGALGTVLSTWNIAPGSPGYRRHNGGMTSTAADGHAECLLAPPYQPGAPAPRNFLELGDCAIGVNPSTTWQDPTTPGNDNGYRVKLYSRYTVGAPGQPSF